MDGLQGEDRLTVPARRQLAGPGRHRRAPALAGPAPGCGGAAARAGLRVRRAPAARRYGCATDGDTYALVTGIPNDGPHAHADVGNLVVKQGEQTVLADLGQRTYGFTGSPVWRVATKAHTTIGVLQPDATVRQRPAGSGAVSVEGADLLMSSGDALPGVASWARRVAVAGGTVRVQDSLVAAGGSVVPLSMSFLLAAAPATVARQPDGSLRFTVADGSVWALVPPPDTLVTTSDAAPTPPYVDAPDIAGLAAAHTLVVVRTDLAGSTDLTTELRRVG